MLLLLFPVQKKKVTQTLKKQNFKIMAPIIQNVENSHNISLTVLHFCDLLFFDRACG